MEPRWTGPPRVVIKQEQRQNRRLEAPKKEKQEGEQGKLKIETSKGRKEGQKKVARARGAGTAWNRDRDEEGQGSVTTEPLKPASSCRERVASSHFRLSQPLACSQHWLALTCPRSALANHLTTAQTCFEALPVLSYCPFLPLSTMECRTC